MINIYGKKITNNSTIIANNVIDDVMIKIVNSNIKSETFYKYDINDLITITEIDGEIKTIDYNMQNTYDLLIDLKKSIMKSIEELDDIDNYKAKFNNGLVILKVPIYNFSNNILIVNIGPKIDISINMVQSVSGSINTKVKTYGINSLLVELYVNFYIKSSIVIPLQNYTMNNKYDIIIASKIIQGKIPNLYNGLFSTNSPAINI